MTEESSGFKQKQDEFEQMLEEHSKAEAITKYYKTHARTIITSIAGIALIIAMALSNISVGQRLGVMVTLVISGYVYRKKVK